MGIIIIITFILGLRPHFIPRQGSLSVRFVKGPWIHGWYRRPSVLQLMTVTNIYG